MIDTDTLSNDNLLAQWEHAKQSLDNIKANEMHLRKAVSKRFFPKPEKGTQRMSLQNGWALKLVHKLNYNLPKYEDVKAAQLKIRALGNEGTFLADRLVKFSADLSVSEFNKLNDQCKEGNGTAIAAMKVITDILTITDAAPELKLEAPAS